jgi:ABC-type multidrug transport system fused ATPase/permease subunit
MVIQQQHHYKYVIMDRNKTYEKRARLYPVIITLALPFGLLSYFLLYLLPFEMNIGIRIFVSLIPTGLLTAAFSYYFKNFIRSISKWIFQFRYFKQDESYMPTTELLLWNNSKFTDSYKKRIREKIKEIFNVKLFTKESETKNEQEARKLIAETIPQLRNMTRDNDILFDYNCYFGSIRNALAGCVIAMIILAILFFINLKCVIVPTLLLIISFGLYLLCFIFAKPLLSHFGYEYARKLYDAFMQIKFH